MTSLVTKVGAFLETCRRYRKALAAALVLWIAQATALVQSSVLPDEIATKVTIGIAIASLFLVPLGVAKSKANTPPSPG